MPRLYGRAIGPWPVILTDRADRPCPAIAERSGMATVRDHATRQARARMRADRSQSSLPSTGKAAARPYPRPAPNAAVSGQKFALRWQSMQSAAISWPSTWRMTSHNHGAGTVALTVWTVRQTFARIDRQRHRPRRIKRGCDAETLTNIQPASFRPVNAAAVIEAGKAAVDANRPRLAKWRQFGDCAG